MDNWKLQHINSSLNVWGIALWQPKYFTEVTDRTLWSIKDSRSAVFFRIHLCKNKTKRSLVRILSIFYIVFVWATRRRAIEKSWHLHSIYPILAAGSYLPQAWHLSKLTMPIRNTNFKTSVAQNIPERQSGPINCGTKAYFDAYVYNLLSLKAISPFFIVCTVWLYTLSQCIAEQNQLVSDIILPGRSYALGFCRKLKFISS